MSDFLAIWFVCTATLLVTVAVFAGAFVLGIRSPYIGGIVAVSTMLAAKGFVSIARKSL